MRNKTNSGSRISRRKFIGTTAAATAAISLAPVNFGFAATARKKPNSNFGGVQIGAITYSWRSMPSTAKDIVKYCVEAGISSIELMGNVAEEYAGIPQGPPRPPRDVQMSAAEKTQYQNKVDKAKKEQRDWRLSLSMNRYKDLRKMFNDAGINIHIVKFAPASWSDEEIDYAFKAAKVLGAKGITNEIGEEACQRLGKFAEKHNMYAIFHNMLNFDAGHYFGATGNHPNEIIERLHDRIFSIHTKDKTGKNGNPPNTNMPWGKGDTPIADMLKLVQKNKWPIYFDIELEYPVPEGSDAQEEVKKCVQYCKNILV
jgi:sugar phosphate isomerase/epimerase